MSWLQNISRRNRGLGNNLYFETKRERNMMIRALCCLLLASALLGSTATGHAADLQAHTDFRYQGWTSDADESGSQFYVPLYLRGALGQTSWEVVAGYTSTSGTLEGNGSRSISGLLDTQLNLAYALPQILGLDWLVGVDTNLPTGQTSQDPKDLKIMIDPDLVTIVSPGKGLDVNPFINVARRYNAWTFGLGMGYAFQGEYDYSSQDPDYNPGDILNVAAEALHQWQSGWQGRLFGQYATFGTDTMGGQDLLKNGDSLLLGAGVRFERDLYGLGLTVKRIARDKSEYRLGTGPGIGTEAQNSYGDEWLASIDGLYRLNAAFTATAALSYVYVAANDYPEGSIYHVGQRAKTALDLGLGHALNEWLQLQAGIGGFLMNDDPNWMHPNEARSYHGWSITLSATTRF
jgi:hypothetical protein